MVWSFERKDHREFKKNPLISTDAELRFLPILRIGQGARAVADFQDAVRRHFPKYSQNKIRGISVAETGQFDVSDETQHTFSSIDGCHALILGEQSIRFSSRKHKNRDEVQEKLVFSLEAFKKCFGMMDVTRFGIRYVNVIDINQIQNDLKLNSLTWSDLVSEEYLKMPHEINDTMGTSFVSEIRSPVQSGVGVLCLRYGLMQSQKNVSDHFRFDMDRYVEEPVRIDVLDDLLHLVEDFTSDIFALFLTMTTPLLNRWMSE